ncbi:hypothetical protein Mal48_48660 [Thalassoglobus polymorphus]|uniref:Uncharacterized protein n=1 Tax=Thalassoglobus polymorphus TaxID=2527994 RepID=A0A517QVC5_9PLAN|nr:hypothetical protein Mal48_48660 [Thalassoglobus polymorphus]
MKGLIGLHRRVGGENSIKIHLNEILIRQLTGGTGLP